MKLTIFAIAFETSLRIVQKRALASPERRQSTRLRLPNLHTPLVFCDPVPATAIHDRLLHHATTINIKGESYRLKEKRKAGLLARAKPNDSMTDTESS